MRASAAITVYLALFYVASLAPQAQSDANAPVPIPPGESGRGGAGPKRRRCLPSVEAVPEPSAAPVCASFFGEGQAEMGAYPVLKRRLRPRRGLHVDCAFGHFGQFLVGFFFFGERLLQ